MQKSNEYVDSVINHILELEGGYTNDPKDSGGETNFGITIKVAEAHGYKGKMVDLPREKAVEIYKETYWKLPNFDKISDVHEAIAIEMFDTGVNCGTSVAGKMLQTVLNALNKEGSLYKDLVVDGLIGSMTIGALKELKSIRGEDGMKVVFNLMNCLQGTYYIRLTEQKETNEEFIYGWAKNRLTFM